MLREVAQPNVIAFSGRAQPGPLQRAVRQPPAYKPLTWQVKYGRSRCIGTPALWEMIRAMSSPEYPSGIWKNSIRNDVPNANSRRRA